MKARKFFVHGLQNELSEVMVRGDILELLLDGIVPESELNRLVDSAMDIFKDEAAAYEWFARPHFWLQGMMPIQALMRGDCKAVGLLLELMTLGFADVILDVVSRRTAGHKSGGRCFQN
jgi:hypothetical protein